MNRSMRQWAWQWVLMGALLIGWGATSAWAQNTFPANGNVGIGTLNPGAQLQVVQPVLFDSAGAGVANNVSVGVGSGGVGLIWRAGNALGISTASTEKVRIDASGNVGIGTLNPGAQLQVVQPVLFDSAGAGVANNVSVGVGSGGVGLIWRAGNALGISTASTEKVRIDASGNVGIGTTSPTTKLHVAGDVQVDGNLAAKYQDVAEWVKASNPLPQGTVVVIDPHRHDQILPASQSYDTRVAGVVSARPGLLLGEAGEDKVKVAQSGRVKVKVDAAYGPIAAGDLLVTSPTPGHAMRSSPVKLGETLIHRPGTLLGKALEPLEEGQGEILVLLTLQ